MGSVYKQMDADKKKTNHENCVRFAPHLETIKNPFEFHSISEYKFISDCIGFRLNSIKTFAHHVMKTIGQFVSGKCCFALPLPLDSVLAPLVIRHQLKFSHFFTATAWLRVNRILIGIPRKRCPMFSALFSVLFSLSIHSSGNQRRSQEV